MGRTADADRRLFQLLLDFATTLASQTDARTNAAGRDGPDDHEVVDHDNGRRSALATLITRSAAVLDIEGIGVMLLDGRDQTPRSTGSSTPSSASTRDPASTRSAPTQRSPCTTWPTTNAIHSWHRWPRGRASGAC